MLATIIVADLAVSVLSGVLSAAFAAIDGFSGHPSRFAAVLAVTLGSIVVELLLSPVAAAVRTLL